MAGSPLCIPLKERSLSAWVCREHRLSVQDTGNRSAELAAKSVLRMACQVLFAVVYLNKVRHLIDGLATVAADLAEGIAADFSVCPVSPVSDNPYNRKLKPSTLGAFIWDQRSTRY
jgi:hypothetical protein